MWIFVLIFWKLFSDIISEIALHSNSLYFIQKSSVDVNITRKVCLMILSPAILDFSSWGCRLCTSLRVRVSFKHTLCAFSGRRSVCGMSRLYLASSTVMVPSKHTCPVNWKKRYLVLLTGSLNVYQKSKQLCLHESPDFLEGSWNKDGGRLFYPVKSVCGSLPCPPYKDDMLYRALFKQIMSVDLSIYTSHYLYAMLHISVMIEQYSTRNMYT